MTTVKEQVQQLGEALPEDVTWEQVMYEVYVREKIEKGEQAISERRTVSHDEVRRRFSTG
jgi:hypothetical protein